MTKITIVVESARANHRVSLADRIHQLETKMADMKSAVDSLVTRVSGLTTQVAALDAVVDNVVAFEQGQAAKIAALEDELKNGGVDPALIAKVMEVGDTIQSNADSLGSSKGKLVAASTENVPSPN